MTPEKTLTDTDLEILQNFHELLKSVATIAPPEMACNQVVLVFAHKDRPGLNFSYPVSLLSLLLPVPDIQIPIMASDIVKTVLKAPIPGDTETTPTAKNIEGKEDSSDVRTDTSSGITPAPKVNGPRLDLFGNLAPRVD